VNISTVRGKRSALVTPEPYPVTCPACGAEFTAPLADTEMYRKLWWGCVECGVALVIALVDGAAVVELEKE
jgi:hypothetical protein